VHRRAIVQGEPLRQNERQGQQFYSAMGSEKDSPSPFLLALPDAGPGCTLAIEIPLDHLRHVDVGCGLNPSLLCLPDAYAQWTACSDQRFVVTIRAGCECPPHE